jgi:phage terminase large subunit-like protein
MKVDYTKLSLTEEDWQIIHDSIENNPFIPIKPYPKQLYAICDKSKRKLIGGSAYSGKSILGAVLALQHFKAKNYRCLILRSTYDNVIATGGIVDYIDDWVSEFPNVEHNQSKRVFINHDSNAKIYYSYMLLEKDKEKFKSRAYHRIIVDEASEFYKVNLQFLNRSLRGTKGLMKFPLSLYYISNPADADGSTYLKERFVDGPYPFFEMNFWDNPYIDKWDYLENLKELSKADYQFQMGNWDYEVKSGDVFDHDMIEANTISKNEYQDMLTEEEVLQQVITWDIAATDKKTSDYTAWSLSTVFKGKIGAIHNQDSTQKTPGKLEQKMMSVMDRYYEYDNWIERQPAAAGKLVARYWKKEFQDYHPTFIDVPKSKLIRASRMVRGMNKGKILFVRGKWLKQFKKQAVKFPTEKVIADDETTHDDRVDSVTLLHEGLYPQRNRNHLRKRRRR